MITYKELKVLDKNAEYFGTPQYLLMENAGKGIYEFVKQNNPKKNKILIFCGTGNNGGDGFVAARYLKDLFNVTIFLVGNEHEIKTEISRKNFNKLKKTNIIINEIKSIDNINKLLTENDIIIDSMLGIGLSGELKEPFFNIVKKINKIDNKIIISVDVPTGLGTNISIIPNVTLTFHDKKEGMNFKNCGEIKVIDIGIPDKAINYIGPGELITYYPLPKKKSHKGENGRLLIIGGGEYIGAPALTGLAALRTGADLVYIATPKRIGNIIASYSPNLIVEFLNSNFFNSKNIPSIKKIFKKCNAIVIGPGLGNAKETEDAIKRIIKIIKEEDIPLVIDADALKPAGEIIDIIKNSKTVITPHKEEFRKFANIQLNENIKNNEKIIKEWAKKSGITIILKGYIDIISDGIESKLNIIHNNAMTVGGTGDVLAGIIGALLSKGVKPFDALRIAAFINGMAGNIVFDKKSYGLLATDIINEIPYILKKYLLI